MRTVVLGVCGLATAMLPSSAMAQTGPQTGESSFTGPRIEAFLGWDNFSPGGGDGSTDSKDSVSYGGGIGYDFEVNGFVIGADVELGGSGVMASWTGVNFPTDFLQADAGRDVYAGARVGYAFTPNIMAYVKAGYTNLQIDTTYNPGLLGGVDSEVRADNGGFRVGIGGEYLLESGVYIKGEYRYSHYGDNIADYDVDLDRNEILLGVGYRF